MIIISSFVFPFFIFSIFHAFVCIFAAHYDSRWFDSLHVFLSAYLVSSTSLSIALRYRCLNGTPSLSLLVLNSIIVQCIFESSAIGRVCFYVNILMFSVFMISDFFFHALFCCNFYLIEDRWCISFHFFYIIIYYSSFRCYCVRFEDA